MTERKDGGMILSVCIFSTAGAVYQNNQDNFFIDGFFLAESTSDSIAYETVLDDQDLHVLAVFDGMGGRPFGAEAALSAVEAVGLLFRRAKDGTCAFDGFAAVKEANQSVCRKGRELGAAIGSTMVLLAVSAGSVQSFNVGDSRAYLFRNESLTQLSQDHTERELLKKYIDSSNLGGNRLLQYLGVEENEFLLDPFVSDRIVLQANDVLLLCSDGLTDILDDTKITELLLPDLPDMQKAELLVRSVLEHKGKDNITAALIRCR